MLQAFADLLVYQWLGLAPGTMLGEALNFFVYDSLKIFLMLTIIIFGVSITVSIVNCGTVSRPLACDQE